MHDFFRNLNWALLREREGEVPFVPQLDDEQDVSYFIPKVASSPRGTGQSPFVARQVRARRVASPFLGHTLARCPQLVAHALLVTQFDACTRWSRFARSWPAARNPLIVSPLITRPSQCAARRRPRKIR